MVKRDVQYYVCNIYKCAVTSRISAGQNAAVSRIVLLLSDPHPLYYEHEDKLTG